DHDEALVLVDHVHRARDDGLLAQLSVEPHVPPVHEGIVLVDRAPVLVDDLPRREHRADVYPLGQAVPQPGTHRGPRVLATAVPVRRPQSRGVEAVALRERGAGRHQSILRAGVEPRSAQNSLRSPATWTWGLPPAKIPANMLSDSSESSDPGLWRPPS